MRREKKQNYLSFSSPRPLRLRGAIFFLLILSITARAQSVLDQNIPEVRFDNVPLAEAIEIVRAQSRGANLHVNWRALEIVGVTRDLPVSLQLREIPLRKVLDLLVDQTGAGTTIAIYVDEGVIEITTRELADEEMITRVYPIDDLLIVVPDFQGPNLNLEDATDQGGGAGGGAGGLFGDDQHETQELVVTDNERAQEIISLITETIRPEIWRHAGGPASIRYFNNNLIITAPRTVHERIGG